MYRGGAEPCTLRKAGLGVSGECPTMLFLLGSGAIRGKGCPPDHMETAACCVATDVGIFTGVIRHQRQEEYWPMKDSFLPLGLPQCECCEAGPKLPLFPDRRGWVPCRAQIGWPRKQAGLCPHVVTIVYIRVQLQSCSVTCLSVVMASWALRK